MSFDFLFVFLFTPLKRLTNGTLKEKVDTFTIVSFFFFFYILYYTMAIKTLHIGRQTRLMCVHSRSFTEIAELFFVLLIFNVVGRQFVTDLIIPRGGGVRFNGRYLRSF